MNRSIKALLLLSAFLVCHLFMRELWGDSWSEYLLTLDAQTHVLRSLATWVFIYGPFLIVAAWLCRDAGVLNVLGLVPTGIGTYVLAALACCVPMIVGYGFLSTALNLSIPDLIRGSVYPGIFEEIIFRAVLFGVLFRFCGWGFIPAALVSSLIFGVGHLYQSNDLSSAVMLMGFMAVAGSWFAWLYCECGYRVWFPAAMHVLMNGAYGVFSMSGGAMGEGSANLFKATAIILSILYVRRLIKLGKPREVSRDRLWVSR